MIKLLSWLKLMPVLVSLIIALEGAIPISGAGKQKLDLILAMVQDIYQGSSELKKSFSLEELTKLITTNATRVVELLNAFGVFNKSPVAPAAVP